MRARLGFFVSLCLTSACGGDDNGRAAPGANSQSSDAGAADGDLLVRELTSAAKQSLCERTRPYAELVRSSERECEESALTFATDFGEAPFDGEVCKEVRTSCLEELRSYDDGVEDPPCAHLGWFGAGALATCDVTVAELEGCWKAMAEFHGSYSCERPAAYGFAKSEQVDACFTRMEARCEGAED